MEKTMGKGSSDRVRKRDQFKKNHGQVYPREHRKRPGKTTYVMDKSGNLVPKEELQRFIGIDWAHGPDASVITPCLYDTEFLEKVRQQQFKLLGISEKYLGLK
jgi:hypothetical protein